MWYLFPSLVLEVSYQDPPQHADEFGMAVSVSIEADSIDNSPLMFSRQQATFIVPGGWKKTCMYTDEENITLPAIQVRLILREYKQLILE